jgi:tetratricopeptide (TPR) repeat protein
MASVRLAALPSRALIGRALGQAHRLSGPARRHLRREAFLAALSSAKQVPENSRSRGMRMLVRAIGVLILTLLVAACGDDRAVADCNEPRNVKRQIEACTSVVADNPKAADALNNRCQAYNRIEETGKALNDCNAAIKLQPNNASAYNNRGWAYEIRKEYDLALADYTKAIQLDSRFAVAYANRGDVYFKKGDKAKATTEYRLALEIDPANDVALNGMKRLGLR